MGLTQVHPGDAMVFGSVRVEFDGRYTVRQSNGIVTVTRGSKVAVVLHGLECDRPARLERQCRTESGTTNANSGARPSNTRNCGLPASTTTTNTPT